MILMHFFAELCEKIEFGVNVSATNNKNVQTRHWYDNLGSRNQMNISSMFRDLHQKISMCRTTEAFIETSEKFYVSTIRFSW